MGRSRGFDVQDVKDAKNMKDVNDVKDPEQQMSSTKTLDSSLSPENEKNAKMDIEYFRSKPWINHARTITVWLALFAVLALVLACVFSIMLVPRCRKPILTMEAPSVYEIYVRSYKDSDGDGMGDLIGVSEKLDYIKSLGVAYVLLDSVFEYDTSVDFNQTMGLNVINFTQIAPQLGNLSDMEVLISEAQTKGLKILLKFIPNHTGRTHPWFTASVNKNIKYKNYYVWEPCNATHLPNNWLNVANGQSAWTYDAVRGECYLHQFSENSPDLNYWSQQVQDDIVDVLTFWLNMGVAGFSLERASYLFEDYDLRDEMPTNSTPLSHVYTSNLRESRDVIRLWSEVIRAYGPDRKLIVKLDNVNENVSSIFLSEVHDSNVFQLSDELVGYNVDNVVVMMNVADENASSRVILQLSSPEMPRIGSQPNRTEVLHLLAMTLPRGFMLYYGDELGMGDAALETNTTRIEGMSYDQYRSIAPMLWTNETNAGFSTKSPWLPISQWSQNNTVAMMNDTVTSMMGLLRSLFNLVDDDAFVHGNTHLILANQSVLAFVREWDGTNRYLIVVNLGGEATTNDYTITSGMVPSSAAVVVATDNAVQAHPIGSSASLAKLMMPAHSGIICIWPYTRPN